MGRYAFRLAERMRDLVELSVVAFADAVPMDGVRIIGLRPPQSRIDRFYLSPIRAGAALRGEGPDLIHSHGDDWPMRSSTPLVRSFYGSAWNEAKSSSGVRRANHLVLALTEAWSARRAVTSLGIAPESVDRFGCDLNFPPFLQSGQNRERAPLRQPTVAFVGSFCGRKRGWLVQDAIEGLNRTGGLHRASGPPHPVRLQVVGPAADSSAWAPWVEHHSGLDDSAVRHLLSQAWLLAAPSEYEGFGIPTVEALEQGLAVVASHNPGTSYLDTLMGTADSPLLLAADGDFAQALASRLAHGPTMTPSEAATAEAVVAEVAGLGSPDRLLDVYERVSA